MMGSPRHVVLDPKLQKAEVPGDAMGQVAHDEMQASKAVQYTPRHSRSTAVARPHLQPRMRSATWQTLQGSATPSP